jgi:hypothetical protein
MATAGDQYEEETGNIWGFANRGEAKEVRSFQRYLLLLAGSSLIDAFYLYSTYIVPWRASRVIQLHVGRTLALGALQRSPALWIYAR